MKKKYMAPSLGIYEIVEEGMIAASIIIDIDPDMEVDQLSRHTYFFEQDCPWDDDIE